MKAVPDTVELDRRLANIFFSGGEDKFEKPE